MIEQFIDAVLDNKCTNILTETWSLTSASHFLYTTVSQFICCAMSDGVFLN